VISLNNSRISPVFGLFCGIAILAAGLFAGCRDKTPPPVVLAQVDQVKLTLSELRESFPAEYEKVLPREQYLDVIQRWIDDEAVYQQALKRKIDQDPQVRRKLERLRRRMIIEEFLAREIAATSGMEPDEASMERYYETHKSEFLRKTPVYKYQQIRVATLKEALAVRAKLNGGNFGAMAAKYSLDSNLDLSSLPYRKPTEIPTCLHDLLNASTGWLSGPVSCPDGVYLVRLQDRISAGTALPFAEVREAISGQLVMQHKGRMRETKIRQYKEGVAVSLNVDQIPGQEAGVYGTPMPGETTDSASEERLPPGE
jgi:parvulin-like peptidyl-prolyl isomerase